MIYVLAGITVASLASTILVAFLLLRFAEKVDMARFQDFQLGRDEIRRLVERHESAVATLIQKNFEEREQLLAHIQAPDIAVTQMPIPGLAQHRPGVTVVDEEYEYEHDFTDPNVTPIQPVPPVEPRGTENGISR